jgi:hypothetical protein
LAPPAATPGFQLGFLSVLHDVSGYFGAYLVTNRWGRPVEFRLTSAVLPNRIQQILFGETLEAYICADLIGKTLHDKTAIAVQLLLTDCQAALDLRGYVSAPVAWLSPAVEGALAHGLVCHRSFPDDMEKVREVRSLLEPAFNLAEPFTRIREAIAEARRMGVTGRAAA